MMFRPEPCPYCRSLCEADWADVGVGLVQCGPYHCEACGASEIGPYDKQDRALTSFEEHWGWYLPRTPPGSSANALGGRIVGHREMLEAYRARWQGNPEYEVPGAIEAWYADQRRTKP